MTTEPRAGTPTRAAGGVRRRRPRRRRRRVGRAARQPVRDLSGAVRPLPSRCWSSDVGRHPRRRGAPAAPVADPPRSAVRPLGTDRGPARGRGVAAHRLAVGAFRRLGFAFLAADVSDGTALWPFLLVAPLVPVLGVAAAYGPRHDPLETLVVTAPYGRTRLILVRTLAVLVSVLPVTALLGLALPGPPWVAAAWLGPALALVPLLLASAASSARGWRPRSSRSAGAAWCSRAAGFAPPGRSRSRSRWSTSRWPRPPAPSSPSGQAPIGTGSGPVNTWSWRCQQVLRRHPRPRRRRPRVRPGRHRPARPQRRRQDDAAAHRGDLDRARPRRRPAAGPRPARSHDEVRPRAGSSGTCRRSSAIPAT